MITLSNGMLALKDVLKRIKKGYMNGVQLFTLVFRYQLSLCDTKINTKPQRRLAGNAGITLCGSTNGDDRLQALPEPLSVAFFTCSTFSRHRCVRLQTRKMCVSTAIVNQIRYLMRRWPFYDLHRQEPSWRSSGTSPLCCSQ